MTVLQAIILGTVQGLTEFLPVSSSGHLVLAEHLLKVPITDDITFEVFVHFGTLLSVLVALWPEVREILRSARDLLTGVRLAPQYYRENEYFRLGILILVGSIPAAVIGIRYEDAISETFTDPKLVAVMLVLTGLILFLTRLATPSSEKRVGIVSAILIGVAQALAIVPGISRSGSTISTAMYLRVPPLKGARFSFLLSVPVIAGATLMKTKEILESGITVEYFLPILVGTAVAFSSGYLAIRLLLRIIEQGRFSMFSFYCLGVGTIGIVFI
ncbi:MAG: undecaprenyl-diphosphate phosphatase [Ignavibacteriales bacterium]|nr:undecaprenyl-diphosphate phosphatase [Ignavibacteriales bacterium]